VKKVAKSPQKARREYTVMELARHGGINGVDHWHWCEICQLPFGHHFSVVECDKPLSAPCCLHKSAKPTQKPKMGKAKR
jgi:hypothetical protein